MSAKSRVLLIGSGGVGTIGAYNLEAGGKAEVTAILRSNFNAVAEKGFTIVSCDHGNVIGWRPSKVVKAVPDVQKEGLPPFDFIFCATKNVADIPPTIAEIITPAVTVGHTVIILVQNGLNIEIPFFAAFPQNIVLSGVSMIGSHEVSPGSIHQDDKDILQVGAFHNPNIDPEREQVAAKRFIELYVAALGPHVCEYIPDVPMARWRKLVFNASWNPVCAVTGLDIDRLRHTPRAIEMLVRPAMLEILAIARAAGTELPEDVVEWAMDAPPMDLYTKPSMMVDVEKGNFTEFENLLGEPVRAAQRLGVAAPTLTVLYELCSALQWKMGDQRGLFMLPPKITL